MTKQKNQESTGIEQGVYETIEIIPKISKRSETLEQIVNAVSNGKYYVMRRGFTQNSIYEYIKELKEKYQIDFFVLSFSF